jgi:hypothetical protein
MINFKQLQINLFFLVTLLITIVSCKDSKKEIILNFLNNTEKKFDKNNFELVNLSMIDTIYEIDKYQYSNYRDYYKHDEYEIVDSVVVDTAAVDDDTINDIFWDYEPYSKAFYNFIRYDGNNSYYYINDKYDENNFLMSVVKSNYYNFKVKLIGDLAFQNKLKSEISQYPDYFKGVFSSDSLIKFINIEKEKSKIVYGYRYDLSFRSNDELRRMIIIFDNKYSNVLAFHKIRN